MTKASPRAGNDYSGESGDVGRMKILISAYSCEPGKGSEPGVGWNVAWEMAKRHEVWVLTRATNRPRIEAGMDDGSAPNLRFVYCDLPTAHHFYRWEGGTLEFQLYYYVWQIYIYFVARRLHRKLGFDLSHHVTFGKYWGPSFLSLLPIPFIWGPVGGGESAPRAFWRDWSLRGRAYEALRDVARWLGEHDPFVRLTARHSTLTIVTTPDTEARIWKLKAGRIERFPGQTGLSQSDLDLLGSLPAPEPSLIRFVSIGRLLHWKGFHLGLRAFAEAHLPDAEYWVIGDGSERERLEALANKLGVADRVRFWGALSRPETLRRLGECHALVHPAVHDFSPTVCLEAMASGRPVICLDLGGPATQVTWETGMKASAQTPEQSVKDMAAAMNELTSDPELRARLGSQSKERARTTFSWAAKAEHLNESYYRSVAHSDKSAVPIREVAQDFHG